MSYVTQQSAGKPAGMSAALVINGGIIAGVMLSPMVVRQPPPREPIGAISVKKNDPPPLEEEIKQIVEAPTLKPIFTPPTPIERPPTEGVTTTPTEVLTGPIVLPFDGTGTEIGKVAEKIKKIIPPPAIFKAAIRDPRWSKHFQPEYPTRLLQREIEGSARVKVLIGTNGRVRDARVVSATHPAFGKATVKRALAKWRFRPATRDGKPVEDWQTLTVHFNIT